MVRRGVFGHLPFGLAGAVLALGISTGCVSIQEGAALRSDVDALKDETARLQRDVADANSRQAQVLGEVSERLGVLESTLTSLRQADADAGVQLERVVAELHALRGEVDLAKHELGQQKASVESILARPPVEVAAAATAPKQEDPNRTVQIAGADVPTAAKEHYIFAKKLYDEKKFAEAVDAFELYAVRHPKETDLDNAVYWKADSLYQLASGTKDKAGQERAYKQAILAYQRVLENPKSGKADLALYKIGLSFEELNFHDEARVFYEELIAKYPKSPLVSDAKKRMRGLRPAPKAKRGR
jgi:TolA-binding protein